MASLERPDGVEIAWNERGEGPLVVLANQFFGRPATFEGLLRELERDHRIVTYDPRGVGESTRSGPYNLEVDAEDLEALIESQGEPAVVLAFADGCNRAVRVAARRPDLVTAIVSPAGNPVGLAAVEGTEGLAGSSSVIEALLGLMEADYRSALRTMFTTANPDWDEESVRDRVAITVEAVPQEAAVPRMKNWVADDVVEEARAVGDRLWMLDDGSNMWFSIETSRRSKKILPDAHVLEVEGGALSRPDIAAGVIRRLTSASPVASEAGEQAL